MSRSRQTPEGEGEKSSTGTEKDKSRWCSQGFSQVGLRTRPHAGRRPCGACALPTSPDPHSLRPAVDAPAGSRMREHTNGEILTGFSEAPPGCTCERGSCACVTCVCVRVHSSPLCQCAVSLSCTGACVCARPSIVTPPEPLSHSLIKMSSKAGPFAPPVEFARLETGSVHVEVLEKSEESERATLFLSQKLIRAKFQP